MARKKKQTRKYIPRNEFRYNNSREASGHPHYVFGSKDGRYYSLGITSHPKKEYPYYSLQKSPNPSENSPNYIQRKPFRTKSSFYGKPLKGWSFSQEDMHTVRHITKTFKKSRNKAKK